MTATPAGGKEIWLFTARFPRGHGEYWLDHELPYLSRKFKRVVIFPLFWEEGQRDLPANVVVHQAFKDPFITADRVQMLRHVRLWVPLVRALWISAPRTAVFIRRSREIVSLIKQGLGRTLQFKKRYLPEYDPSTVVMYSNWAQDWATILGMLRLVRTDLHFVTRLHGFDLYDHRAKDSWQMFQRFNLEQASHIYTTSKAGADHVLGKYPHFRDKISTSHTATLDHGPAPWEPAKVFRLVSCANLYPIKRVPLIAKALAGIEVPVHWTHFGGGEDRELIEQLANGFPPHVTMELKGAVPNTEVIEWYKREPADLFVHVSSTEGGVAVALQEAASFGIPLLGADAGGVSEIVNSTTGELLPHDVTPELLRRKIEDVARNGFDPLQRERVRLFWKENFHADVVHEKFVRDLFER